MWSRKSKALMTQLFELTQQHAKKLALNSVESMEYQRERAGSHPGRRETGASTRDVGEEH